MTLALNLARGNSMREAVRQLDFRMRQFSFNVEKLMQYDGLFREKTIGMVTVQAVHPHMERGRSSNSSYGADIVQLTASRDELEEMRDYYLHSVREIMLKLQCLDDDEVEFCEFYYWNRFSMRAMCQIYYQDASTICRQKERILEKMLDGGEHEEH
jgi:hypothetical protein